MTGVITKEQCESWLKERGIASWDADGNPLNLEAAARDAANVLECYNKREAAKLRKFLPEGK